MSKIIVEEVDKNDLTEAELQVIKININLIKLFNYFFLKEFVTPDEIPIVEGLPIDELNFPESEYESTDDDEQMPSTSTSSNKAKQKKKKGKKQLSATSEKIYLKKFINGEISLNDYAKRMNEIWVNDDYDDSELDSDDSNSTMKRIKNRSQKQKDKAETHHMRKIKRALPPALQGLMGQANLSFAQGDNAMAEKLCLEIIRQEPEAAEPYLTLSQICENSDEEMYKELLLLAAHVISTSYQWLQVAEIMLEKNNLKQANFCLAKATRCDPKNLEIRLKRIEILRQLGDEKHELHCRFCMLGFIPKEDHKFLISQAKLVAKKYHQEGLVTKSLDAMLKAYNKVPEHFNTEDVHSFIELLMNNQQYRKCLSVLVSHTGLSFKSKQKTKDFYEITDLFIPDDMLMDLRTKMCICLIQLDANNLLDILIDNIYNFIDVERGGDCYLDIAETLIAKKLFKQALRLLNPLVHSNSYSLAAVWLLHADCLRAIEDFSQAIESYKKVVELSQHKDAKLTLAALLKQENRLEEAIEALTQDPQMEILCTELLKEKCLLLKDIGRIDDYLENGYTMLLRHCVDYRSRQEVQIVSNFTRISDRLNELKNLRRNRDEPVEDLDTPEFSKTNEPTVSDDWNMFCDLIKTAWEHKRYAHLQKLSFAAMSSRRMQHHVKQIDFIGAIACLFNKEEVFGYNKIREFLSTDKSYPRYWNLFNLIIYVTQDTRHHRFVTRLFDRHTPFSSNVPPLVYTLIANYCLLSNSYKYALNHYDEIYRRFPSPLIAMILGILYSQIANQKFTNRKQNLVVQGMNYFEIYRKTREPEAMAEILYNTGRYYHQVGMLSLAKDYYEQALKVTNPMIESDPEILDLKRTIAFNLHIIYKQSGNKFMARKILYEHIVV